MFPLSFSFLISKEFSFLFKKLQHISQAFYFRWNLYIYSCQFVTLSSELNLQMTQVYLYCITFYLGPNKS